VIKVTFTLDDQTVSSLERLSERLSMPKSRVVREAIRLYGKQADRVTDEERDRMLEAFDELAARIPSRPRAKVKAELADVRKARRGGGRRSPGTTRG
jgi:metal-responsive CopG/Arc/MetJ family transcriptional regulator